MKTVKLFLFLSFFVAIPLVSIAQTNGNTSNKPVVLQQSGYPRPRVIEVENPEAMYNTVTDVLTITLDATYYGEYTIIIESDLTTVDYYPTSSTTVIPLANADNSITIYIESDDCGCWYGELDKAEFGGQLDT